jgi:hypothetical protein
MWRIFLHFQAEEGKKMSNLTHGEVKMKTNFSAMGHTLPSIPELS